MNHRKLSVSETAGTYRITASITEAELLSIVKPWLIGSWHRLGKPTHLLPARY